VNHEKEYELEVKNNIKKISEDKDLQALSRVWLEKTIPCNYAYNFKWLGRPIIQEPQDIVAIQELIWKEKPDLVVDIGIARGGSLILCASIMALLDMENINLAPLKRKVLGVDIDIRKHNRIEIENHPVSPWIEMIEGSSIDKGIAEQVKDVAKFYNKIMIFMDSNHTHDHVLKELELYAPLVTKGSYCVVFDTGIEDLPEGSCNDRHWGKGNNPKTAVWEYLKTHKEFKIDKDIEHKLLITAAPDGYLKRVK